MKILWLASWYPSAVKPLNGDFIQRHAQAASLYNDIEVLFVEKDIEGVITKDLFKEVRLEGRLTEKIIYYHDRNARSLAGKLLSNYKYHRTFTNEVKRYIKKNGLPDLVHVHIAMKAGLIAKWIKRKYKVPYVLSEHWSGYLSEATDQFSHYPLYYRYLNLRVIKNALAISTVSKYLGAQIQRLAQSKSALVIPNVVNTKLFYPGFPQKNNDPINFIHISTLSYHKNPEAILRAFSIVKKKSFNFKLKIFGPSNDSLKDLAIQLGLQNEIIFHEEIPQSELANHLQKADALVLYSRYETFGCVIIEANACGVPVIVSDLEALKEIVQDGFNGLVVEENSTQKLAAKILWFIKNKESFNAAKISALAQKKYSYQTVGKQFDDWYKSLL